LIEAEWNPKVKSLARFGRMAPIGFCILGLITAWKSGVLTGNGSWLSAVLIWSVGIPIFLLSWVAPKVLLPVYWILFGFGWLIFSAIGYAAMTLIFILLITPLALIFKLIGRDALHCIPDPDTKSYWIPISSRPKSGKTYFRQS